MTSQHTVQEPSITDLIKDHRFSLISQSKEREFSDTDLNIRVFFFTHLIALPDVVWSKSRSRHLSRYFWMNMSASGSVEDIFANL